jgi:very-short-patch-repair endonuclease
MHSSSIAKARDLRRHMTDAERRLWWRLRAKQLGGLQFRRQVPIGGYIVDFACLKSKLVVELDGGQHASQVEYDDQRTLWLKGQGFNVLRFWNDDVLQQTDAVLQVIARLALHLKGEGTKEVPLPESIAAGRA